MKDRFLTQLLEDWAGEKVTTEEAVSEALEIMKRFEARFEALETGQVLPEQPEMRHYRAYQLPDKDDGVQLMAVSAIEAAKDYVQNWLVEHMAYNSDSFEVLIVDADDYEHGFTVEVEMNQVTTAEHHDQEEVDDRVYLVLSQMEDSGQSEMAGVADVLNGIASNGGNQAVTSYLIGCAEEIIAAAQGFIDDVRQYT